MAHHGRHLGVAHAAGMIFALLGVEGRVRCIGAAGACQAWAMAMVRRLVARAFVKAGCKDGRVGDVAS